MRQHNQLSGGRPRKRRSIWHWARWTSGEQWRLWQEAAEASAVPPPGDYTLPGPRVQRMGRATEYAQLAQAIAENVYLNGETVRLDGALPFTQRGSQ